MTEPRASYVSSTLALPDAAPLGGGERLRFIVETSPGVFIEGCADVSAIKTYVIDGLDIDLGTWAAVARAAGFDAFVTTPSSANLRALVTDETGSGALVFATSPVLVTPNIGTPAAGTLTNCAGLPPAGVAFAATSRLLGRVTGGAGAGEEIVLDTDGGLVSNSDARVASQKAVKTYVDQNIAAQDAMVFEGVIDCAANPNYPAADRGHTYRISVAGKIGGASGINVEAGDLLLCLTDSTSAGNQASVGAAWTIVQTNIDGQVIGPASSTDGAFVRYDGVSGKLLKNGPAPDGTTLEISGSDLRVRDGGVSYAKIQNVSATARILGRKTGSAGVIEECSLSDVLDMVGSAADGDIFFRSGGVWVRLPKGSDGQILKLVSGAPAWATLAGTYTAKTGFLQVTRNTNQTGMTANDWNDLAFNNEVADPANWYSNPEYTPQRSGWYGVRVRAYAAAGGENTPQVAVAKNGTRITPGGTFGYRSTGNGGTPLNNLVSEVVDMVYCNGSTDKIKGQIFLPTGVTSVSADNARMDIWPIEQDV